MAKLNKKNLIILMILIIFIFIVPTKVNAAGSFSINKSSESLTTGATTTIVISASSCAGRFNISSSNTAVATVSPSSVFLDNSRETITITTKSAGTAVISVVADDVTDTDVNDVVGTKTCTITVSNPTPTQPTQPTQPTKSSNANLRTLGITPNDFTGFKAAITEYNVTVPNSVSSVKVYAYAQDSKAKVSGTGNKSLSVGRNTCKVVVTAEDGTTKTYTMYITRQEASAVVTPEVPETPKSSDATLSALSIEEGTITPIFDPQITEYTLNVSEEISEVHITATPTSTATVEITGETELQIGENIATITVTAEDGTVNTYTIKIVKQNIKIGLQALIIGYVDENGKFVELPLSQAFNTDILEYTLEDLESDIQSLRVDALANSANVEIEIIGNENLVSGENIIKIVLKRSIEGAEPEEVVYLVKVNKKEAVKEAKIMGIYKNVKNWFQGLPSAIGSVVQNNTREIMIGLLLVCIVAMIGLSIYIVIDYKKYKMLMEKIRILTKENAKQQMPQNETPINEDKKLEIK